MFKARQWDIWDMVISHTSLLQELICSPECPGWWVTTWPWRLCEQVSDIHPGLWLAWNASEWRLSHWLTLGWLSLQIRIQVDRWGNVGNLPMVSLPCGQISGLVPLFPTEIYQGYSQIHSIFMARVCKYFVQCVFHNEFPFRGDIWWQAETTPISHSFLADTGALVNFRHLLYHYYVHFAPCSPETCSLSIYICCGREPNFT